MKNGARAAVLQLLGAAISTGLALAAWIYFMGQDVAVLQEQATEGARRDARQDEAIVRLEGELRNVSSLRLQIENNRAIIEVHGKRIDRRQERE